MQPNRNPAAKPSQKEHVTNLAEHQSPQLLPGHANIGTLQNAQGNARLRIQQDTAHQFNPFSVGYQDLDPFQAAPGFHNPSQIMRPSGGMIVGPDHPMFNPNQQHQPPGNPIFNPYQQYPPSFGPGRLPQNSVPPGARFDPITPFGLRPGFSVRPGRPGPSNGMPFSSDPDNDEFMPPGSFDPNSL